MEDEKSNLTRNLNLTNVWSWKRKTLYVKGYRNSITILRILFQMSPWLDITFSAASVARDDLTVFLFPEKHGAVKENIRWCYSLLLHSLPLASVSQQIIHEPKVMQGNKGTGMQNEGPALDLDDPFLLQDSCYIWNGRRTSLVYTCTL